VTERNRRGYLLWLGLGETSRLIATEMIRKEGGGQERSRKQKRYKRERDPNCGQQKGETGRLCSRDGGEVEGRTKTKRYFHVALLVQEIRKRGEERGEPLISGGHIFLRAGKKEKKIRGQGMKAARWTGAKKGLNVCEDNLTESLNVGEVRKSCQIINLHQKKLSS